MINIDNLASMERDGYCMVENFLSAETCAELTRALLLRREANLPKNLFDDAVFRRLIFSRPVISAFEFLLGENMLFHHANGQYLTGQQASKPWHHDFDGECSYMTSHPMIHAMFYPLGLNSKKGSLALLPGTHRRLVPRSEPNSWATSGLGNEVAFDIASTSVVFMNSALWHTRRLGTVDEPRPYLNVSFCSPGIHRPERDECVSRHLSYLSDIPEDCKRYVQPTTDSLKNVA